MPLAEVPRDEAAEVEPLSMVEVQLVLTTVARAQNGARWALALPTGLRQGEVLGLQWGDIDGEKETLAGRRSLARKPWQHGCPRGVQDGLITGELKTRAGRRSVVMPGPLVELLAAHRRARTAERLRVGEMWQAGPGGGWLFV